MPQDQPKSETKADKIAEVLDKVATPDWRVAHRTWSVQLSILWALLCGGYMALPAFQNWMSPVYFALTCMIGALLILFGRLANQPSLPLI